MQEAEEKNIRFLYRISSDLPESAKIDKNMFDHILSSILDNAIKFTHEGEIELCVATDKNSEESSPSTLNFCVRDTGIGIEHRYIDSIFSAFSQEDNNTNREYDGAGLSLYISKRYVEGMGGKIWCESEKTKGTTILFTLPLTHWHYATDFLS